MSSLIPIPKVKKEVKAPTERIRHSKQKALEISINEGSAASFSSGIGHSYITPFALALNSSPFQIGILSAIVGIANPVAQLFGSNLMHKHSRKNLLLFFTFLEVVFWIPLIIISYLFLQGTLQLYLPYAMIISYALLIMAIGAGIPAWFSWMGDLVPENKKGAYFSKRNRITAILGLLGFLIGAFILDFFKTKGTVLFGFMIIFGCASLFRLISHLMLRKEYNPKIKIRKKDDFSFIAFLKKFDNFGRFSVYKSVLLFSRMIAGPFFAVYMLTILGFNYLTFTIVVMSSSVFYIIFNPIAGKFSDKFGNVKLIYLANILVVTTPLFWLFLKSPIWLILFPQLISAIVLTADTIGTTNFTYDCTSPAKRGTCVAYLNLLTGIGIFLGSLLGGILIKYLSPNFTTAFFGVIIISSTLRLIAGVIFLPKLKEWKKVKRLPPMKVNVTHPFRTVHQEIGWVRRNILR